MALDFRKDARIGGNFSDPTENGVELLIRRIGEKKKTVYEANALLAPADRRPLLPDPEEAIRLINEGQIDIGFYIQPPETLEDLNRILQGGGMNSQDLALVQSPKARAHVVSATAGEIIGEEDTSQSGATGDGF